MNLKVAEIKNIKYSKQIKSLYENAYWAKDRTEEQIKCLIKNSTLCMGVFTESNILIAFARSMSDLQFVNCIYDVMVKEEYRNKKIDKMVVEAIINHSKLKNIKGHVLYCKHYSVDFYEKLGFEEDESLSLMVLKK